HGAKILNLSFSSVFYSQSLADAIAAARADGIIAVVAAGNYTLNIDVVPVYPASFPLDNIVSVGMTDQTGQRVFWSDYGLGSVDLGAPGYEILSCWFTSDSAYQDL